KSQRDDGAFSRSDFQYDDQSNSYECPGGKRLTTTGRAKVALSKGRKRKSDTCIKDRGRPRTDQGFCVRSQSADKALPPSSQTEFFNTIDPQSGRQLACAACTTGGLLRPRSYRRSANSPSASSPATARP